MKKILVQFSNPGMTAKQFDQAWDELRKAGQEHPYGLIHHVAGQQGNNWVVVDVWESAEAMDEFGKTLMPILSNNGIPQVQPTILPLHYEYIGK